MNYAAEKGLIYHLWWHPHNFGNNIEENFSFLEKILKAYETLNRGDKMESENFIEIFTKTMKIPDEK